MPVYKDDNNGTFYVQCYYRDARGSKRHKTKRGFSSEVEAAVWEGQFKSLNGGAMDMTFSEFVEVYASEVKPRIREHTWITKEYIINDKLVPFFGDMRMCDVRPIDVIRWQNELTEHRDAEGKSWAPTYLRTVNNQLNAIFNHAERYYGLTDNPVRRVDKIGSKKGGEMQFWTKDEYLRFSEAVMDKPLSFHAFELLYWTGIRCGELLGAHAVRLHAGELPASHQQVVPEPPRRGHRDRPQDAQVGAHDRHARLPARRDGGLHRAARRRCARRAPVRRDQALPGPRDGARVQGVWSEAHPRTRHTPQPCEPADRDGLLRAGHRRAHGPRGGGHHLPLRAPVPHEAGRDGRRARRSEGVRRMPCENSARKRNKTMAFRCTPEEHKLICEMAAWSGMLRQDYIIAKLTDTEVEVRPSVSMQKALKDSMVELAKEVKLAASYGELSDSAAAEARTCDEALPGAQRADRRTSGRGTANEGALGCAEDA